MNKPLVPEDIKRARPAVYLCRAAAASLKSFVTGASPVNAARAMWGDDRITDIILRAVSSPATTGTPGWAQSLAGVAILDLVQSITSLSAAADVIDRALKLNMDGIAEYRVPGRPLTAAEAGQWVAEGMAAPVRMLSFSNAALLHPHKLQVNTAYTREMAEHSNIEAVVRQTLEEATGLALDLQMFSADPGDATKPPGLFAGATAIGGTNAMTTDLGKLFAALAAHGGGKTAVIIAALPQAVTLKATVGPKWDYDIIASTGLAPGTVAVLEIASFLSGFGSTAEFNTSKVAAVHMEADTPADLSGSTPVKSMFQVDAIALKTSLWAAWGLRAAGHCQYLTGATW
jgi:hypothetical protein